MRGKFSITVHTPGGDVVRHFDNPRWMIATLNAHPEWSVAGPADLERTLRNEWAVAAAIDDYEQEKVRLAEERAAARAERLANRPRWVGPPLAPGAPQHGINGYANYNCRCVICTAANSAGFDERRKRERPPLPPDDPRHGTDNAYHYHHCTCGLCRDAHNREHARGRSRRKVPAGAPA